MSGFYNSPSQGVDDYPSLSTPMQRGTSPLECWYSGVVNQTAYSTGAASFNQIFAYPVIIGKSGLIDRIAFEVTTNVATAVGRAGIYDATSKYNIYPKNLIVDGGEFDCGTATGIKSTTVNVALKAGLYWFVIATGVATPTLRIGVVGSCNPILGVASTVGANASAIINVSVFAYGALPSTFPSGASQVSSPPRLVHVRFTS